MKDVNCLGRDIKNINTLKLLEICFTLFKWHGLPNTMDELRLEQSLSFNGSAVAGFSETYGLVNGILGSYTGLDFYGYPNGDIRVLSMFNGYSFTPDKAVICYNNKIFTPNIYIVEYFANVLTAIDKTLNVNLKAIKTPVVFKSNSNLKLTVENFAKEYDNDEPYIFIKDKLDELENFKVFQTGATLYTDELIKLRKDIKSIFLTLMGVDNVEVEKKERLITGEIEGNNKQISLYADSMLFMRQKFCDEFNSVFKDIIETPISVEFRGGI